MNERARPYRRRVLLNTVSTSVGNVWAMVVALVSVPLLLRGLGEVAFGTWVLLQTFSALNGWLSLADLGVGTATTKAVAERAARGDEAGVRRVVGSGLTAFAGLGALVAIALAVAGTRYLPALFGTPASLRPALHHAILLFSVQVFVDLVGGGCGACIEGLQRLDLSRGADAVRRTAIAAATIAAALSGGGLRGVAAASLGGAVAGTVLAVILLATQMSGRPTRPSPREVRGLVAYGSTIGLLDAAGVLHRTMDRLIVGAVVGPAAVTLVEIATQIQNGAAAILSASSYTAISASSWLSGRGDRNTLRELLERGTKYSVLITIPFAVGAMVLAGPIVQVWVGDKYLAAVGLVPVAMLAVIIPAPLSVASNLLQGIGKARDVLGPALGAVALNLAASLILVHVMGIVGVFVGTLAGMVILVPFLARAALRATGVAARTFLVEAVVPCILPTLALAAAAGASVVAPLGSTITVVLAAVAGAVAYTAVAARTSVRPAELVELREIITARAGQ